MERNEIIDYHGTPLIRHECDVLMELDNMNLALESRRNASSFFFKDKSGIKTYEEHFRNFYPCFSSV